MSSLHHSIFYVCLCGSPCSHLNLSSHKMRQTCPTNHVSGSKDSIIFFKLHPPHLLYSLPASLLPLFDCSPFVPFIATFILQPSSSLLSHLFRIRLLVTCKFPEANSYKLHFLILHSPIPASTWSQKSLFKETENNNSSGCQHNFLEEVQSSSAVELQGTACITPALCLCCLG